MLKENIVERNEVKMVIQCGTCFASLQNWMRYCPKCGVAQVHLKWVDLSSPEGVSVERLNVDPSETHGKKVRLYNAGQTKVHLRLDDYRPPSVNWINFSNLQEELPQAFVLEAGECLDFDLRFDSMALREAFAKLDTDASLEINTCINFLCTDIKYSRKDEKWDFKTLELPVFLAKRPFISPNLNLFRFLSWERLEEGFDYTVYIGNFSPEERKIKSVTFDDLEDATGVALTIDLPAETIAEIPVIPLEHILEDMKSKYHFQGIMSHTKKDIVLRFQSQGKMSTGVGRFYGLVSFELDNGEVLELVVGGLLGHEPKVELKDYDPLHQNKYEPVTFRLYNNGDLPLELTGVSLYESDNENTRFDQISNLEEDWLLFKQSDLFCTLQPKEVKEVQAKIVIGNYQSKNDETFGFRQVVFHHANEMRFATVASVQVEFGITKIAEHVYVGIDFGTSNSMVSVVNSKTESATYDMEILEIADDSDNATQLNSLLWYTSSQPEYLVGAAANINAGQQYANLVRSMKTIVNQDANERFSFIHKSVDAGNQRQKVTYRTAQELMNFFINVLSRSSERYLSGLVSAEKEKLGLKGANITLSKAIFTHPVDVGPQAFQALMTASHAAGINKEYRTVEEFKEKCCVDESTAAALYFVYSLVNNADLFGYEADFEEKILCVDIGGGTSDITPIYYEMDAFGLQSIEILPSKGVERLGGDQLDIWLAELILTKLKAAEKSEETWVELADEIEDDIDNLWMSLNSFSFQAFTDSFQSKVSRLRGVNLRYDGIDRNFMLNVFKDSSVLRQVCEKAKIELSDVSNPVAKIPIKFWNGSGKVTELQITQKEFQGIVQKFLLQLNPLIDSTLAEIFWSYDDISIVLFTGQTTYSEQLRDLVIDYIASKRTQGKKDLFVVHPDPEVFCPKSCVAKGGALYPILTAEDSPITVIDGRDKTISITELPSDVYLVPKNLQKKLKPLPNFVTGAAFPVSTTLKLRKPKQEFAFYAKDATEPMFEIKLSQGVDVLEITISSLSDKNGIMVGNLSPDITAEVVL